MDENYETDEDGLPREIVGPWARDKYARLEKYVGISAGVRGKFLGGGKAGATYIDLFCGPARVRIKDQKEAMHGSPLIAWHESLSGEKAFTQVHIADADQILLQAAEVRLKRAGAPVLSEIGPAIETVNRVIAKLNPHGLHLAFLDPYNLADLPFEIIRKLAAFKHMDILIHVSGMDLQRNLKKYIAQKNSALDTFAPNWRKAIDTTRNQSFVRGKILEHWRNLVHAEGMTTTKTHENVVGSNNQPLYWLAFAARHPTALKFWEKSRDINPEKQLPLL